MINSIETNNILQKWNDTFVNNRVWLGAIDVYNKDTYKELATQRNKLRTKINQHIKRGKLPKPNVYVCIENNCQELASIYRFRYPENKDSYRNVRLHYAQDGVWEETNKQFTKSKHHNKLNNRQHSKLNTLVPLCHKHNIEFTRKQKSKVWFEGSYEDMIANLRNGSQKDFYGVCMSESDISKLLNMTLGTIYTIAKSPSKIVPNKINNTVRNTVSNKINNLTSDDRTFDTITKLAKDRNVTKRTIIKNAVELLDTEGDVTSIMKKVGMSINGVLPPSNFKYVSAGRYFDEDNGDYYIYNPHTDTYIIDKAIPFLELEYKDKVWASILNY